MAKKSLTNFANAKCSILEVSLGSHYTLSVEMLLDRFGQSNKF